MISFMLQQISHQLNFQLLKMTGNFPRPWWHPLLHCNCRRRDIMDSWTCTQGTLPTLFTQKMMSMNLGMRLKVAYPKNAEGKD